ncbi:carboxypeptidase regulatory-like domain-containing protein [Candidatus Hydrogenedentota bacterium]
MMQFNGFPKLAPILIATMVAPFLIGGGCVPPGNKNQPALGMDKKVIDFGGVSTTATGSITLKNVGGQQLAFETHTFLSTTTTTPSSGTLGENEQNISVTVDLSSFEEGPFGVPSIYSDVVTIESEGGQGSVEVIAVKVEGSVPVVTGVNPNYGTAGQTVTLSGANFQGSGSGVRAQTGAPQVFFGEEAAAVMSGSTATSITVTVPTLLDASTEITVSAGGSESAPAPVDFVVSDVAVFPSSVSGSITDANTGLGVAEARIELEGQGSAYATMADGNGSFDFSPVPPIGVYRARVSANGYQWQTQALALGRSEIVDADVQLTPVSRPDFVQSVTGKLVGQVIIAGFGLPNEADYSVFPTALLLDFGTVELSNFIRTPTDICAVTDPQSTAAREDSGVLGENASPITGILDAGPTITLTGSSGGNVVLTRGLNTESGLVEYMLVQQEPPLDFVFAQGQTATLSAPGGSGISSFTAPVVLPPVLSETFEVSLTIDPTEPFVLTWDPSTVPGTRVWATILDATDSNLTLLPYIQCNLVDDGLYVIPPSELSQLASSNITIRQFRTITSLIPVTTPTNGWVAVIATGSRVEPQS